jgi:transcriptional regulator with PAS, ATPase and Fis domain
MPALLQAKLLRVLEERTVRRLGGMQEIPIDVRVLAATNREPHEAVRSGILREDLLYRLNVITIELPPLRRRKEDLPLLAQYLITHLAERHDRPARHLSPAALDVLKSHHWPGNVRELRNVIERAVARERGDVITAGSLSFDSDILPPDSSGAAGDAGGGGLVPAGYGFDDLSKDLRRKLVMDALRQAGGRREGAAALLGLSSRHQLARRMKKLGITGEGSSRD